MSSTLCLFVRSLVLKEYFLFLLGLVPGGPSTCLHHPHLPLLTLLPVCLIGHSILNDLRLLLSSKDVDLHDDFNLLTVSPVWKTVRGLTFPAFVDTCLEFLDSNRLDIVFLQFAGNDQDSTSSVTDITERYLRISYSLLLHCSTKIVICEALPHSKTRHCTVADYAQRRHHFNSSLKSALVLPDAPKGRLSSTFVDPQVWFWLHEKLQGGSQLKDGVHLTPQGLRRLYFSVRMVLREATKPQ